LEWRGRVKILLDTCSLIWATMSPASLGRQARETLADEDNVILVSAASAWEIATKVRLGNFRRGKVGAGLSRGDGCSRLYAVAHRR